MVETITPAVCGGRRGQLVAFVWFSVGAGASAATFGALVGWVGAAAGRSAALGAASLVALLATVGFLSARRLLPQLAWQVPESWRRSRPSWQWGTGYGAILAVGILTYQPLGAAWVAIAASATLTSPHAGATAMLAFAAGRLVMVVIPNVGPLPRSGPVVACGRHSQRLAIVAFLVGTMVFASEGAMGAGRPPEIDATASGSVVALTRIVEGGTTVIIRRSGYPTRVIAGASQPALDGPRLAVRDRDGIRVLDWTTGRTIARIRGRATTPALAWPRIAFRRREGNHWTLVVRDLRARTVRVLDRRPIEVDLGRPAIRGRLVAWHVTSRAQSMVLVADVLGAAKVVLRSTTRVARNPALGNSRLAWIEVDAECSRVLAAPLVGGPVSLVAALPRAQGLFWNVHLGRGTAIVTRWQPDDGTAQIRRFSLAQGPIEGCALGAPRSRLPAITK